MENGGGGGGGAELEVYVLSCWLVYLGKVSEIGELSEVR